MILPRPLTNFETQKYYHNEPRFNGVILEISCLKNIKDGVHITNLNEYSDTGTHWITLYVLNNNVTYLTFLV